jgi:predicted DNA-binding transcriptional regulator AlpA
MLANGHVSLAELLEDPARVREIPADEVPPLLVRLTLLAAALASCMPQGYREPLEPDRLMAASEAASMLGVSRDTLYRSPALKPLRVKVGSRVLFSYRQAQAFIHRRAGR